MTLYASVVIFSFST